MNLRSALFLLAFAGMLAPSAAVGQSSPSFSYGQVPTAAQWNDAFSKKQDILPFAPLSLGGGSLTGRLATAPSTTAAAKFAMPPGTAPTLPASGDMWATSGGFYGYINNTVMQFAAQAAVTAEANRAQTAEATKAPVANPTFTGTASVPILAVTGSGSTGDISGMSVTPQGASTRPLSAVTQYVPTIDASGNMAIQSGPALGTYNGGVYTSTPDAIGLKGTAAVPFLGIGTVVPPQTGDSTAALNAAIASLPSTGGRLNFTCGTYSLSGVIEVTKRLHIDAQSCTTFDVTNATSDIFVIHTRNADGFTFDGRGMRWTAATVTRTAGSFIRIGSPVSGLSTVENTTERVWNATVRGISFANTYRAVVVDNTVNARLSDFNFEAPVPASVAPGSALIVVGENGYAHEITIGDKVRTQQSGNAGYPAAGIILDYVDVAHLLSLDLIQMGQNILIRPIGSHIASLIMIVGGNIDTATNGVVFQPLSGGQILRTTITGGGWMGVMSDVNVKFIGGGGTIAGVLVQGWNISGSTIGVYSLGTGISDVDFDSNVIAGMSSDAIHWTTGTNMRSTNNRIGSWGTASGNQTPVRVEPGVTGLSRGDIFTGNTNGPVNNAGSGFTIN